jgi:GntR family transcriptional regulator
VVDTVRLRRDRTDERTPQRLIPAGDESTIDRGSPVPLYFQLARLLSEEIVKGHRAPGERLASEPEIGSRFRVSRPTVRLALQRLESEGLIERIKGRGTFIADSRERSWLLQSSEGFFHEEVERLGFAVSDTVLRAEVAQLPTWAAEALGLPEQSHGAILERLRYVDGRVALHVSDFLPVHLAAAVLSLRERGGSLYERLEEREGVTVYGGRRTLEATFAESEIAGMLDIRARTPIIFIESVAWGNDLQPFHCFQTWLRTDRIRIEVQVAQSSGPVPPQASPRG